MEHRPTWSSARVTWILPTYMQGDHETGSNYYCASVRDRNAILASKYRFPWTPNSMEHRPTWSSARVKGIMFRRCNLLPVSCPPCWYKEVSDVGRCRRWLPLLERGRKYGGSCWIFVDNAVITELPSTSGLSVRHVGNVALQKFWRHHLSLFAESFPTSHHL